MSISEPMHMSKQTAVQRIEVFTGTGRRRSWTPEEKAEIVAESYAEGDTVCSVARRHGLTPQQLFTWRRQARQSVAPKPACEAPLFVPAVIEAAPPEHPAGRRGRQLARKVEQCGGVIEMEIDGVTVRVGRGADVKTVAAVIRALKAGS
jgi:transposase